MHITQPYINYDKKKIRNSQIPAKKEPNTTLQKLRQENKNYTNLSQGQPYKNYAKKIKL